jgi:Protein of unknown function (DUF1579)
MLYRFCALLTLLIAIQFTLSPASFGQLPEELAILKQLEGKWDVVVTTQPENKKSTGVRECKFVCGGRWLATEFDSKIDGQEYQARSHQSFDVVKKKFVTTHVDSLVTAPMIFEGAYDKDKSTFNMTCNTELPDAGKVTFRSVYLIKDADHQVMEMYLSVGNGGEFKVLTMEYTRRK